MMTKAWFVEANSSIGGLIEMMKDYASTLDVKIYESVDNPLFWLLEVSAPRDKMAGIEDIVAPYM